MTQQRYGQQWMIEKLQEMAARLGRSPTQVEADAELDQLKKNAIRVAFLSDEERVDLLCGTSSEDPSSSRNVT